MFKIIKKGNGNFWHNFNNGSKEVNLSNWEIVLDSINQTVSLQMLNGANVPINSVDIADVVVIDETDISLEETFGSVSALRTRLIELNYTPYIVLNGFVPEAPIDGLTYGRKDAEWVEVTGGGGGGIPDAPNNANAYVRSALSWVVGYTKTAVDALLGNKVDANAPITGTVKTKITYDSKGLVIAGADALTSDIADSLNKRYVTDAQLAVIGNTSGTNTGDNATNSQYSGLATSKQDVLTDIVLGALINGYTSKTTPVGADGFLISNSADSNKAYKVSYTNLSATLKAYFDTLYANPALIVKRILNDTVETTALTGTTSETLIYSAPVIAGGTFTTNDYFNFQLTFRKNGISETACTYRVKVSNTNNYATATLIASWQSQRYNTILQRLNLYFKSNGTLNSPVQTSTNTQTDLTNSSVSLTSISLDPTQDIYFFVSAQLTTSSESVTMNAIKIFN